MRDCSICNNSIKYYDYYDNGNENEFVFIMELCDANLMSLIQRKNGFTKEEIYYYFIQLNIKVMEKK